VQLVSALTRVITKFRLRKTVQRAVLSAACVLVNVLNRLLMSVLVYQ